ncbi:MAG: hypothetical protein ABIU63_18655 [Chitinophagaceae bacterium]
MKKILTLVFFLSGCCIAHAQRADTLRSWKFQSINSIGLLNGQAGTALQLQTVNGVQHKSWFAGVGIGLDYYRFRGIPVFVDIRKMFGATANKFFIYGDAGIHFNWMTARQKESGSNLVYNGDARNGLYTDVGIGYAINTVNKNAFILSAGYSYKRLKQFYTDYSPIVVDGAPIKSSIQYGLNRIVVKAGLVF